VNLRIREVLDTNVLLMVAAGRLSPTLFGIESAVSIITEMEVLAFPKLTPDQHAAFVRMFDSIVVVGLTQAVKQKAIEVRREKLLKLPDAIVAATAMTRDAELVTMDAAIQRVPGLRVRFVVPGA
jgi:predicted nucleic acid-binding protein